MDIKTFTKILISAGAVLLLIFLTGCPNPADTPADDAETAGGAVPQHMVVSLNFTDIDLGPGELCGDLIVAKAEDESDITHYVLYWGSSSAQKLAGSEAIASFDKSGTDFSHHVGADTVVPSGAAYFLVYTKNDAGEMSEPTALAISDTAGTVYTGNEGTAASPIVLDSGMGTKTYNKEIGQGRSYYSHFQGAFSVCSISITGLTDDVDLVFYTDSTYTTVDTARTRYYGRTYDESAPGGGNGTTSFFVIDGSNTGYKLNAPGAAFTLRTSQDNGSVSTFINEGSSSSPKAFPAGYRSSGMVGAAGTSYYEIAVSAGVPYMLTDDSSGARLVYTDQFVTEALTLPVTATGSSLFVSVAGNSEFFDMEIVNNEGRSSRPIYLITGKTNYCWVGNGASYYMFHVSAGSSYTATVTAISFSNNVDLYTFNGSGFSSSAGEGTNSGTADESVTFTATEATAGIMIDDVTGNGASFQLKLSAN